MAEPTVTPKARMKNPVFMNQDAMHALQALGKAAGGKGVPTRTLLLVQTRASQINGCGVCLEMHARELKQDGETEERLAMVAAWREAPYFTAAERAALALTEAATRLCDRDDPVPDTVWDEAARHYDERALGTLVIAIAAINAWNRINVTTRQVAASVHASASERRAAAG